MDLVNSSFRHFSTLLDHQLKQLSVAEAVRREACLTKSSFRNPISGLHWLVITGIWVSLPLMVWITLCGFPMDIADVPSNSSLTKELRISQFSAIASQSCGLPTERYL